MCRLFRLCRAGMVQAGCPQRVRLVIDMWDPAPPPAAAGEGHKAAKSKVREERVAGISKVVGLSKLRTKYESHEAKRQLCNSYDMFAADERILPSLPKLLGAGRRDQTMGRTLVAPSPGCLYCITPMSPQRLPHSSSFAPPMLAGKAFFKKKKQPVPVRLTGKDWAGQIRRACEATYLFWSGASLRACTGCCTCCCIGCQMCTAG